MGAAPTQPAKKPSRWPSGVRVTGNVVTMPPALYESLIDRLDDAEDALIVREAMANRDRRNYLQVRWVNRMLAGTHPVRVWREHRGLTLSAPAEKAGLPHGYLSEIENGGKPGSLATMRALAIALGLTIDDIVR